ncbi:hypothetical protein QQX98_007029 [Neonectria punicea]|uniref:Jacalin-type lectin domain-containing protein n=1 Tax=Neonectria punicea TaxID=979145 RepID=A0ABR1GZ29_9HYPO
MAFHSFFYRALLVSPLFSQLINSTPIARLQPRQTTTVEPSFADVVPVIVDHGPMDDAQIDDLVQSLLNDGPVPTETPTLARRQGDALAVTTASVGAFQAADIGDPLNACEPEEVTTVTIEGPVQTLQFFTGTSNIRSFDVTSLNGNTSNVVSAGEKGDDAGAFIFRQNERITEFSVFATSRQFTGFSLITDADRTYSVMTGAAESSTSVKVPVGSGIIGRIRYVSCQTGVISMMGFDFLDELDSIAIAQISYSGFTDNILPSGPGQTTSVGSQSIDNRNSTVEQSTNIQTTAAITRSYSLTTTLGWTIGASVTISGEAGIPFLTKSSVSTTGNWDIQGSAADQEMEGETITNSGTVNLKCPARKFCIGTSFFTIFKLDVDVEATFQAMTKSGESFNWVQKGRYKGADSAGLELKLHEVDTPPE